MISKGVFIADRYEVIDKVGAGGMSDVYKAKDHILGREVAIKVLKQEFSEDATFVAKFRTEAQSAAGLEHPNIVNIYDVGSENGRYFIVMEYVEGITLKTYIEKKGQLNFKEAISIAIQVGRGIEAAHSKGIIHRDIKPQNIIISTEGKVKVTDFGIARAASSNTIHADVMGSVHYASPEQARNGYVDGKSDIYSLGIVMYEMVTGRVPFDGDNTVAIALQHLQEEMVAPSAYAPDLPISLEKIIMKATQKNADKRYATISDMLMDLKKALVSPHEDFVTIVDAGVEKTRVITQAEQETITQKAAQALTFDDDYAGKDEEYYDDEEDDYYEGDEEEYYEDEDEYYDDDDYYDEEDDHYKKKDHSDKLMTILGIVAGIAIVIVLVVILGNVFGLFGSKDSDDSSEDSQAVVEQQADTSSSSDSSSDSSSSDSSSSSETSESSDDSDLVSVPSVTGLTQADATTALQNAKLTVTSVTEDYSDTVEAGKVISQSVAAGQQVAANTNVTLVVSKGSKETSYSFKFSNPNPNGECTYTLETGNTGTLQVGQTGSFQYSKSTCEITYTYTVTNEDGSQGDTLTNSETLYGTAN